MPPVRYAVHPVPASSPANIPPTMASLNTLEDLPGWLTETKAGMTAIFPPNMKEIYGHPKLPWLKRCGMPAIKPFLRVSGTLGSKGSWPTDHGFEINKGGFDAGGPRGGFFSPYNNPNLENGPKGESLTIRLGQETANFIESQKGQQPALPCLSLLLHRPCTYSDNRIPLQKISGKSEKDGLR